MATRDHEKAPPRPAPRRRGWIPLGLSGQILLLGLLVPAAMALPEAGASAVAGLERTGRAVVEQAERCYDALEAWASGVLDPRTRSGDAVRDERWASEPGH